MGFAARVDRFQQRHPTVAFPLAVTYKFVDDQGIYLAALITYYGFLSLFPLLLLLASVLGSVLSGDPDLQQRILDSTLSQFPVIGEQLRDPQGMQGSGVAAVVGAVVAIYGALGVAQALQNALNIAWAVPRHRRPNPIRARLRSLLLIVTAGLAVLATTTMSVIGGAAGVRSGVLSVPAVAVTLAAVAINAVIFGIVFRIGTALAQRVRDVVPGALFAAVVWQLLQVFGTAYVAGIVKGASLAYGVFAVVLGLLAWIFLAALGVVVGIEINVVAGKHLYPRALLTPFTDRVDLTSADRRSYTDAAVAQRHKGFEDVVVTFANDGQNASGDASAAGEPAIRPLCDDGSVEPHPVTPPFVSGLLDVGDGHLVHWEAAGNPTGKPAVILHGGPGAPLTARARRMFDPERYLIVQFDQRQCGRSTPHASDPVADLSANTTAHLIADMEQLRRHLDVERWLVWGGSWGTTLGLAYAETHPAHVSEMVLASVVGTSQADVEWVTRSMGKVFPQQWEAFRDGVPPGERDGDLAAAYARLLADPDPAVHDPAAAAWCAWEDTHVATYPGHRPDERYEDPRFRLCFARLVTHYWRHAAFLEEGALLRDAHRLAGIPIVMVNGQLDISGPLEAPWQLSKVLPDAELVVIGDEGHGGAASMFDVIVAATDRFAG